jgi:gluconokinase
MNNRKDHYMPASLLRSQFDNLEIPGAAFTVNIEEGPEAIVESIVKGLSTF